MDQSSGTTTQTVNAIVAAAKAGKDGEAGSVAEDSSRLVNLPRLLTTKNPAALKLVLKVVDFLATNKPALWTPPLALTVLAQTVVAREPFDFVLDVSNSEEVYNILIWALKLMIVLVGANEFNMIEHYDSLWNIGCKGLLLLNESIKLDIIQLLLCLCGDHALVTCHLDYLLNSILYNLEPSTRSLCSNIDNGLSQLLSQTFGCLDFSAEQYKFLHLAPCILQSSTNFLLKKSICKLMRHLLCSCPPDLAYATVIALMPLTNDITIHKAIIKCINIIPEYSKPTEERALTFSSHLTLPENLRVVPMTIVGLQLKDKQDLINTIMRLYRSEDPQVRLYIASTLGLLCPIMNSGMVDETVNIHKIDTFVLKATAYLQLVQISKTLGLKLKHLLRHFQERIASFLINNFVKMQPYLVDFCVTLMKILPEDFIIDALPLNLPQLVLEKQTPLVTYILLHKEKTQDVFDTLQPYLAAGHERTFFDCMFSYITEFLTNMDLGGILLQITLHFAVDEGKALDAMYDLMLLCERNATRNEERLADFLDSHFLKMEVLILKRTKGHFPTEDKKKLFVGLYHFLPLLGRHLPSFHDNIFIILTCGGPRWKTPESLLCLEVFIHNLPLWALKPLVTKLGAALISWLNVDRAKVASIIAYMVEHKKDLSGEIEKLVLPDNVEELQPIIASIYDTNRDSASRLKSILSLLNDSSNPTVKYQACCDLAKWLSNPKVLSSFYEKVCQQSIPSDLSEILSALLKTSRDPSVQIQVACSECLGKIGAVDPSQLELFATHLKPQEIDEPDKLSFAVTILNDYLYKFIAGTPNGARHCAFGYSIQMILRHLGITTGTHEEVDIADHFWHKFSPTAKATLSKYLSSDYSVSKPETTSFVDRLNSATDDLVHQWVATCTLNLIDTVERLPGESPGIFSFCKPALIYDINLCLYLFPWLVLNVARSDSTTDKTQLIGTLTSALQGSALQGREGANQNQECLKRCCLHVLGLFDWLNQWEADAKKDATKTKSKNKRRASQAEVNRVSEFVSQIKPLELAKAALSYHEYILAYMYLENHLRAEPESGNPKINRLWHKARTVQDLFQPICFGLDDIDFLDGLQSWNVSMNPDKKLLYYEVKNQWAEALHYYQKSIRLDPSNQHLRLGRLKCLRNLGHWESVKIHLDSEHSNPPGSKDSPFTSSAISILWHLEKWDELGGLLSHCSITNMGEQHIPPTSVSQHSSPSLAIKPAAQGYIGAEWEQSLGRCLFLLHKGKPTGQLDEFDEQLRGLRSAVASSLAKASDSYQQAYPHLLQLHILQELEDCRNHIGIDDTNFKTFLSNWNMRLQATQGSYKTQEAILDVRRILFHILEQPQDTFIWRSLSKLSRYWGQLQSAVSIQENFVCPQVFNLDCLYEEIKLSCAKGQIEQTKESLHHLEKLAENGDNRILAKVKIQQAKLYFQEHETLACMEEPLKKAKECHPDGEKVYFTHAMFLDYHLQVYLEGYSSPKTAPLTPDQSSILAANINTLTCQAVEQYAQALRYGHKHSAHSFSRLLTLWCKFGSERDIKTFDYVQDTVKRLADTIPTYMWVSVLPQLTARIAHPNDNTYNVVSSLIKKALCEYPEQATWQVIGLCNASPKSSKTGKKSRYSRAQDLIQNQSRVFLETQVLSKALLRLCTTGEIKNKLSDDSKLSDLVTRWERSQKSAPVVIAPIKSALTVILPSSGKYDHGHTPFPGDLPLLYGLEKEIKVMPSMAKPKRITLKTNKGDLTFLCKPKDDLRRDARMLEFTTLVNKLLAKNPDARRRKLAVTTYAVVPLDDECGLLEWVHNLNGLRIIWSSLLANPLKPNAKNFYENIKRCPPVLHLWFRQQFLDPTEWFEARLRFIRSLAVMSMVGYIIGLGDRHGENLLLSNKADVVHVDFNCLFWQGESLATPEKVPYRLTPNLVDAMGIQGYEGPFRKVSELTLSIMRSNRDSLVSTLETFIFDPLAGFEGVSVDSRFKRLGRLLEGRVDDHTRELSVAAQVNITINTATNYDILSKMYAGWAPWV
ncbi:protein kinase [Pelomyxa schiedti]|nr:protein kinase [Pelomyxa schiedti]